MERAVGRGVCGGVGGWGGERGPVKCVELGRGHGFDGLFDRADLHKADETVMVIMPPFYTN